MTSKWSVRIMLLLMLPFILVLTFLTELGREARRAVRFAWLEVLIEYDSFKEIWKDHNA